MRRWVWGAVALWVSVVVLGAGVAWMAIDRAGRQVSASEPLIPGPTPASTASTGSTPSSRPSGTASTTAPAPPDRSAFRTWTGSAGSLTVSCTSEGGRLVAASPANGWRVERSESGDRIRVKFERNESEVEVDARCAASGPIFEVDSKTGDEGESESED